MESLDQGAQSSSYAPRVFFRGWTFADPAGMDQIHSLIYQA
jgi:hypothetical protein